MPEISKRTPFAVVRADFMLTLRLALPLIIAEVGWMSMGIVDTIMVGRLPDSAIAIGATGLGQSLYHSMAIFGGGLLLGLDTFVSHAYGREDLDDARHSLANGLFLAFVLTPLLMWLFFWPMMMARFGISPELVEPMRPFLRALNWGTLPLLAYFALRRYLQAVNVALPIMFALISANIVNADRRLGTDLRTSRLSRHGDYGIGMVDVFCPCIYGWRTGHHALLGGVEAQESSDQAGRRNPRSICIACGRCSSWARRPPPRSFCEIGAFSAATALIAKLGAVPLSGHEIALNCAALTFMVPLGISSAAAVRVGQQLGRKDPAGARRAGWSAITLGASFMTCSGLVFVSIPTSLPGCFPRIHW